MKRTNQIIHVAWALARCRSTRRSPGPAHRTSCPALAPADKRSPPASPLPPEGPRKNRKIANSRCSFFRGASSRTASPAAARQANVRREIHARITENALRPPQRDADLCRDTLAPTISRNFQPGPTSRASRTVRSSKMGGTTTVPEFRDSKIVGITYARVYLACVRQSVFLFKPAFSSWMYIVFQCVLLNST